MNKTQVATWVAQELAKVRTQAHANERLASYEESKEFFVSPAGIAAEQRDPFARKARHDLAAAIRGKFGL